MKCYWTTKRTEHLLNFTLSLFTSFFTWSRAGRPTYLTSCIKYIASDTHRHRRRHTHTIIHTIIHTYIYTNCSMYEKRPLFRFSKTDITFAHSMALQQHMFTSATSKSAGYEHVATISFLLYQRWLGNFQVPFKSLVHGP